MNHPLVTLLLGALALVSELRAAEKPANATNLPPCCAKELAATAPLSGRSLYQLDSSWTNDAGATLRLADLRGRPQVVTMFFATCQFTCPVLLNDLKRLEAALPASLRTNVGFVLVSFDTERDTPEVLAGYRKIHELTERWTLLRGGPDDVLEFANLLGVKFKKDVRGQFAHSNVITILDAGGEIVRQIPGLNRDPAEAVRALESTIAPAPVKTSK